MQELLSLGVRTQDATGFSVTQTPKRTKPDLWFLSPGCFRNHSNVIFLFDRLAVHIQSSRGLYKGEELSNVCVFNSSECLPLTWMSFRYN